MIHSNVLSRDGNAEKSGKGEEDAAASAEASQTVAQVPITTPPPPVTDTGRHSTYGGYSSWYQVGRQDVVSSAKCRQAFEFCPTCCSCFSSNHHSTAAMATRTPGTTTRAITLPARRGSADPQTAGIATGCRLIKYEGTSPPIGRPSGPDAPPHLRRSPPFFSYLAVFDPFEKGVFSVM